MAEAEACDIAQATSLPPVTVSVGMRDAMFTGGDYREAAYDAFADSLNTNHGNAPAGTYFVPFTYTVSFLGWSATHSVNICITKDAGQTWEEAVQEFLEATDKDTPIRAIEDQPPQRAYEYTPNYMQQVFSTSITFPAGATVIVNGWNNPEGIVSCEPGPCW